uniref:Eukaryotic translation initiation factor 2A n=1 Tax=Cyclopterus lumpus TaxID=8103 RepID=A0A8C2WNY5_CYCLU
NAPGAGLRGSDGTALLSGPPSCEDSRSSRCVSFSRDGTLFGWCNGLNVSVVKSSDGSVVSTLDLPKTSLLDFSPLNNVLATWQPYSKPKDSVQGEANLQLWDLWSGQLIKALYQKKVDSWCPSWSEDEKLSVRSVNNELHFYENNDFNVIANKLHMQKVSDFALSPGGQPNKVAVYVPGSKGAPSFVRLYQYPVLGGPTAALANKSFFKADRVSMQWNKKEKTGPIYDVVWSPNSSEFCVVYGFMPAKATVYSLKCDPLFDFGTGPRNAAYYSPQGHILVLAGFGNLRGQMEVWDAKKYKQVSKPQAPDATHFSWCPDGEHVVTATCSPRLRVSNGYKIWHYTGSVLLKQDAAAGSELWEVRWQPFPEGSFPERAIKYQAAPSDLGTTEATPTQAYRPPAMRHLPATPSSKLHEEELPQNLRPGEKRISKAALKNQQKRENKKAAKQEAKPEPEPPSDSALSISQSKLSSGDPETDRKIKNVKKKLKAIEELKDQQASGKVLQKNQLEKLQKEDQLLKELEELQIC